jgi:formate hydrogenlyase transcriptional activator
LLKLAAPSAQGLLEVAESIALHRGLPALIHDLKERLPRLVNFTSIWLVLHEPSRNKMRLHIIATPQRMDVDVIERNVEDSPSGLVWQTQRPLVVADATKERRFPAAVDLPRRDGVRSFCILPLATAHRRLGGMGFGSQRLNAYREADREFLRRAASQVALGVENALRYRMNNLRSTSRHAERPQP